jgi:serine/threonine-protein kinase ATR
MATFQTMVSIPELSEVTLQSWYKFLTTLDSNDTGALIGPTSAAIVASWSIFTESGREIAYRALEGIVRTMRNRFQQHSADIVDLTVIPELEPLARQLKELRGTQTPREELQRILDQSSSDNLTVAMQSLGELKSFMLKQHKDYIHEVTSGDMFDPVVGHLLAALFAAACREGDRTEGLRVLAFECIGVLGAVDPDRCEIGVRNANMVVLKNFTDEGEAVIFALHLIQDLLVGAFRSTSDIKYQSHLAYSIQELLKFCQFTPALVAAGNTSVPVKVRNRWNALPKHVLETVTPLLEARFTLNQNSNADIQHPIYPTQSTYREWIQLWTTHLITKASGPIAQKLFGVFRSAVRSKDVVVAHHLLPHLVLNILISGNEDDAFSIRSELLTVLQDQVDLESNSTSDKKLLSAQVRFLKSFPFKNWCLHANVGRFRAS